MSEQSYNPKSFEQKWWDFWQDKNVFDVKTQGKESPYTILMPPPNVTAKLHMGHGTCFTFQDILIRWQRMMGKASLWQPGTDHAGIATQMMVEKHLEETGSSRKEIGRDAFFKKCSEWKDKYGGLIYKQFERIGFSADWKRSRYTMDPALSKAVRHVFVELYKEGFIYRGERLVNWDPALQTAVSDDEVYSEDKPGTLWDFKYPLSDQKDAFITISTTRPETMLGDTAVAVHPDDERYKHLVGKSLDLPFSGRKIPIIADAYVKSEFGSGAVKITPAHDPNDFEIGKRHNLDMIEIFNDDATLNDNVPKEFRGLDRFVARKAIIKACKASGVYVGEKSHKHAVPHSDRSKSIIEPKLSKQWFVKMADLAKPAADCARDGSVRFYPETWKKTYLYWLDNIQDWCISRQLWWGHRIPIWYCSDCQKESCETTDPTECSHCQSKNLIQDEDVLDTWFSSWLWPMSTLGWPDKELEDDFGYNRFYPSQVLVTGPDIIFLWVARMIMAGLKFTGKVPFKDVYFTAIVTDKKGRKFSKTLGNGIDPIEVIDKYGADAVRFTGVNLSPLGGRIMMDKKDFEHGSRFANKIWNAAKLIQSHTTSPKIKSLGEVNLNTYQKWLINRLDTTAMSVEKSFHNYRLNDGVDKVYHFIWGDLCDWALECIKSDDGDKEAIASVLTYCFDNALRLLHPVMPFITEELWQSLPDHPDLDRPSSISIAKYPLAGKIRFENEAQDWEVVKELISGIRSTRQQVGIALQEKLEAHVVSKKWEVIQSANKWVYKLANLKSLDLCEKRIDKALSYVGKKFEVYLPAEGLVDFDKEIKRIETEIQRLTKINSGIEKKLSNEKFVKNAPKEIIIQNKEQYSNLSNQIEKLSLSLTGLK